MCFYFISLLDYFYTKHLNEIYAYKLSPNSGNRKIIIIINSNGSINCLVFESGAFFLLLFRADCLTMIAEKQSFHLYILYFKAHTKFWNSNNNIISTHTHTPLCTQAHTLRECILHICRIESKEKWNACTDAPVRLKEWTEGEICSLYMNIILCYEMSCCSRLLQHKHRNANIEPSDRVIFFCLETNIINKRFKKNNFGYWGVCV